MNPRPRTCTFRTLIKTVKRCRIYIFITVTHDVKLYQNVANARSITIITYTVTALSLWIKASAVIHVSVRKMVMMLSLSGVHLLPNLFLVHVNKMSKSTQAVVR